VNDATGHAFAYVYFEEEPGRRRTAGETRQGPLPALLMTVGGGVVLFLAAVAPVGDTRAGAHSRGADHIRVGADIQEAAHIPVGADIREAARADIREAARADIREAARADIREAARADIREAARIRGAVGSKARRSANTCDRMDPDGNLADTRTRSA
jgi:hypothetical protein